MSLESLQVVCVKAEPDWESTGGVSEAAVREDLYADHEIKGELVLGPEVLQSPRMVYELRDGTVYIKMEAVTELSPLDSASPSSDPDGWWRLSARAREQLAMSCSVRLERLRDDAAPRACPACLHTFEHEASLATHVRDAHGDGCGARRGGETQTPTTQIRVHAKLLTHPNKEKCDSVQGHAGETYQCDTCGKQFKRKINLIKHIKKHVTKKKYSCEICYKKFPLSTSLSRHKRVHTLPYSCEICDKKFNYKYYLLRHIDVHTGRKPFACEICSKSFANRFNLIRHNVAHTGRKPFSCEVCNKQFGYKSNLLVHKRIHTGEKPFSCEHCHKRFVGKNDLKKHEQTHLSEKPYSCGLCHKRFVRKSYLKIHKLIHTGEKPYTCDECKKQFIRKDQLRQHFRNKHTTLKLHAALQQY